MSTKIKLDGQWVDVATNELVLGASTVRKGTVETHIPDPNPGYIDVEVAFDEPMPDADYAVDINFLSFHMSWHFITIKTARKFVVRIQTQGWTPGVAGPEFKYTAFKLITIADAGGASEADLEALKTRVTACETKNTAQDTAIAGNTASITANATDISGLKTRMTAAETKNTQQDTQINNISSSLSSLATTVGDNLGPTIDRVTRLEQTNDSNGYWQQSVAYPLSAFLTWQENDVTFTNLPVGTYALSSYTTVNSGAIQEVVTSISGVGSSTLANPGGQLVGNTGQYGFLRITTGSATFKLGQYMTGSEGTSYTTLQLTKVGA